MALTETDSKVLQEIVNTKGNCLDSTRCPSCPFRAMCLPEFLSQVPLSQQQRLNLALEVLSHHWLLDEHMTTENIKQDYAVKTE